MGGERPDRFREGSLEKLPSTKRFTLVCRRLVKAMIVLELAIPSWSGAKMIPTIQGSTICAVARRLVGRTGVAVMAFGLVSSPAAAQSTKPVIASTLPVVNAPPATLGLDPFYAQYIDAGGIPVISSGRVPGAALLRARSIILEMTAHIPNLRFWLKDNGYRVAILAPDEAVVDLPEQRSWTKPAADDPRLTRCERKHYAERIGRLSDRDYWIGRSRGNGGRLTSAGAENLLGLDGDRYHGENIFVHEFSHNVLQAIRETNWALYKRVEHAYAEARRKGLWKDEYAETTVDEYWAEGTQFWFNSNRLVALGNIRILSNADFTRRDPELAQALAETYGDNHRLTADYFWEHPHRVPPGPPPQITAEVC